MSGNKFLFIRILDEELVALFQGLQSVFNDRESTLPVHITIKGPQKSNFKSISFKNFSSMRHPLVISQSDYFSHSRKYFVHFKVQIPEMEKYQLWYKPTFGTEKNPHITVCETIDEDLSRNIVGFLNREVGDLLCRDYDFLQHTSSQPSLPFQISSGNTRNVDDANIFNLINIGKVKKGLFTRARKIKAEHADSANYKRQTILHVS